MFPLDARGRMFCSGISLFLRKTLSNRLNGSPTCGDLPREMVFPFCGQRKLSRVWMLHPARVSFRCPPRQWERGRAFCWAYRGLPQLRSHSAGGRISVLLLSVAKTANLRRTPRRRVAAHLHGLNDLRTWTIAIAVVGQK